MSIDEMPAGPEMDRLVAEAVEIEHKVSPYVPCPVLRPLPDNANAWIPLGPNGERAYFAWSPSTDLNAAVEAACHGCFMLKLETGNHSEWYAEVIGVEGEEGRAFGETPALALCRALLKAMEATR